MTVLKQIWKCELCGNIIEIVHKGADSLICCGQSMNLQPEKTPDQEGKEKHVPIIEGKIIKLGSVPHPMDENHYIEWIEAVPKEGRALKVFLSPGDKPEIELCFKPISARAYCNLHGLCKNQ